MNRNLSTKKLVSALPLLFFPCFAVAQEAPKTSTELTLEEAISLALSGDPSLKQAAADVAAAEARVALAYVTRKPTLNANTGVGASTTRIQGNLPDGSSSLIGPPVPNYFAGANGRWLLYDFGKSAADISIAEAGVEVARAQEQLTRSQIALAVARAYYTLWVAQENLSLAEKILAENEARVEVATALYESGARPKIEVTRAEVDRSNAEVQRVRAEGELARASLFLAVTIGTTLPPGGVYVAATPPPVAPAPDLAALEEAALKARPEFALLDARRLAQEKILSATAVQRRPDLSAQASLNMVGQEFQFPPFPIFSAQVALTIPLFDGGRAAAEAAAARAEIAAIEAELARLRLDVAGEVGDAYASHLAALATLRAAEEASRLAEENEALARARYESGAGSAIEISDAVLALAQAKEAEIRAQAEIGLTRAALDAAIGAWGR